MNFHSICGSFHCFSSLSLHYTKLIQNLFFPSFPILEYTNPIEVTASKCGHPRPRIINDGYSYYPSSMKRITQKRIIRLCTGSGDVNRKLCIERNMIDGNLMLRPVKNHHICVPNK